MDEAKAESQPEHLPGPSATDADADVEMTGAAGGAEAPQPAKTEEARLKTEEAAKVKGEVAVAVKGEVKVKVEEATPSSEMGSEEPDIQVTGSKGMPGDDIKVVAETTPDSRSKDEAAITVQEPVTAEDKVEEDPWDMDSWQQVFQEVQSQDIDDCRYLFEDFLTRFPTAARHWRIYAEKEMEKENYANVDKIFKQALPLCLVVDLWRLYLKYVRMRHGCPVPEKADEEVALPPITTEQRQSIEKAYDYAVDHIGADMAAAPVWLDYVAFLLAIPTASQFEETNKTEKIRKVFRRAVQIPMHSVESVWKKYETWEVTVSKMSSKTMLADISPKFQGTRSAYRLRRNHREGLRLNDLPVPVPRGGAREVEQHERWKDMVKFEKSNTQKLPAADVVARVVLAYKQWLLAFYHYPNVWHQACAYLVDEGKNDEAAKMFDQAFKAVPGSLLLHLSCADFEEARKNVKKAAGIFEKLIEKRPSPLVYIQYQRFARRAQGHKAAREVFKKARACPSCAESHQIYVASALLEYHTNKEEKVARNIFEMGLKKFPKEPKYVLEYIDFLSHLNDHNNLRVVFERVLKGLTPENSAELWERYLEVEYMCGTVSSITKLEKRWIELQKNKDKAVSSAALRRFRFLDLWPCSSDDAALFGAPTSAATTLPAHNAGITMANAPSTETPRSGAPSTRWGGAGSAPGPAAPEPAPALPPAKPAPAVLPFAVDEQLEKFIKGLPAFTRKVELDVEYVITVLQKLPASMISVKLQAPPPPGPVGYGGAPAGPMGGHGPGGRGPPQWGGQKRKEHGDVEDEATKRPKTDPPAYDIYRQRQKQKLTVGGLPALTE